MLVAETFRPDRPRLHPEPVLRFHRYHDLSQVSPAIRDVANQMVALAEELAEPDVRFRSQVIDRVTADSVTVLGGPTFFGRCLGTHLADASEVVCFVATIGPAIDARIGAMAEADELLEALFLESAGWLAIEDTLRKFRVHLKARVRGKPVRFSPRLGPGYLDWSLEEQTALFSVFEGAPLPVHLSEYCVMTPKKSVSGLFGVVPTPEGAR